MWGIEFFVTYIYYFQVGGVRVLAFAGEPAAPHASSRKVSANILRGAGTLVLPLPALRERARDTEGSFRRACLWNHRCIRTALISSARRRAATAQRIRKTDRAGILAAFWRTSDSTAFTLSSR